MGNATNQRKYFRELQKWEQRQAKARREGWDVILDPIELVPQPFSTLTSENWAVNYLGIDEWIDKWIDRIKGYGNRAVIIIHDDGDEKVNPYLQYFDLLDSWETTGRAMTSEDNHAHYVLGCLAAKNGSLDMGILTRLIEEDLVQIIMGKCMSGGTGSYQWISDSYSEGVERDFGGQTFVFHNSSFGGGGSNSNMIALMKAGRDKGHHWYASAGNSGYSPDRSTVGFPANHPYAIAVGAVHQQGDEVARAYYSSVGPEVQWTSCSNVLSTSQTGFAVVQGTSFSGPISCGMAAFMALANPQYGKDQDALFNFMRQGLLDLGEEGRDQYYGFGILRKETWDDLVGEEPEEPIDDPIDDPVDDPIEPPVPDPPKYDKARTYALQIDNFVDTIWSRSGEPGKQKLTMALELDVDTKEYAEYSCEDVADSVDEFFHNRGFIVRPQDDLNMCMYWVARFMEMLFPRYYELDIKVRKIVDIDTGVFLVYPTDLSVFQALTLDRFQVKTWEKDGFDGGYLFTDAFGNENRVNKITV